MIINLRHIVRLCAFTFAFCIIANSKLFAMPQNVFETIEKQNVLKPSCPNKKTYAQISLSASDQDNLEFAKHMDTVMRHTGYAPEITRALYHAHLKTGVDFKLLVLKAIMESDYGRFNVAPNSSARGVFQYIESTWLVLMHRYGAKAGHAQYAEAISYNHKTKMAELKGTSRHLRGEILALRHDPKVSAIIKAYQVLEETDVIRGYKKGKKVTVTDHYIAHMLGLYVMKDFYQMVERRSIIAPAKLSTNPHMREAAYTNKAFFFKRGKALTAAQSYKRFEARVKRELRNISQMKKAQKFDVSLNENDQICEKETDVSSETPATLKTSIR